MAKIDDVRALLQEEVDGPGTTGMGLLRPAVAEARQALRDQTTSSSDFGREMYKAWEEYFEDLIALDESMMEIDQERLTDALRHESAVLGQAITHLNGAIEGLSPVGQQLVGALKTVLEIERAANDDLVQYLTTSDALGVNTGCTYS